jgi:hypothetical protein
MGSKGDTLSEMLHDCQFCISLVSALLPVRRVSDPQTLTIYFLRIAYLASARLLVFVAAREKLIAPRL